MTHDTLERDILAVAIENMEDALAHCERLEEHGETPSDSDERYLCHTRTDLAKARLAKLHHWINVAAAQSVDELAKAQWALQAYYR